MREKPEWIDAAIELIRLETDRTAKYVRMYGGHQVDVDGVIISTMPAVELWIDEQVGLAAWISGSEYVRLVDDRWLRFVDGSDEPVEGYTSLREMLDTIRGVPA